MGQGLNTKVAQVVAEVFQVEMDRVQITATNTDKVPNTSPTAASSGADLNGKAAQNAAEIIKNVWWNLLPASTRSAKKTWNSTTVMCGFATIS